MVFLSHLSGDEGKDLQRHEKHFFLSHLSGDEDESDHTILRQAFLSHLSGDEVIRLYVDS